tara:strand:+ start:9962 stop:10456 length:495 start_codon:yes stop_codon:yes gene_type:complete
MAGEINNIADAYNWSVSQFARAFSLDRRTVTRRIEEACISPAGKKNGHPTYALKDGARAIYSEQISFNPDHDPALLPPTDRKAWYQSENERVKLEVQLRSLLSSHEVHREMSQLAKAVTTTLDSLPDILERDCDLSPEAVLMVQDSVDSLRDQMYLCIMQEDDE